VEAGIIDGDRYFLPERIKTLKAIRARLRPEPVREPLPPPAKPRVTARKRRALMKAKPRVPARCGRGDSLFWLPPGRLRSNFVAARRDATENHAQQTGNPGNVGLSLRPHRHRSRN
jgi:hypothetical protein